MSVDLLRNRNPLARLGPFDGRVGAIIQSNAESYYITTNADYIPAMPSISLPHKVYLRSDMRFGTDDPTLWPQPYSRIYSHLAAIPKRSGHGDLELMWWRPSPSDFVPGSAITRGLGKLAHSQLSKFVGAVNDLVARYRKYKSTSSKPPPELFDELIQNIVLSLERLQMLPSTYNKTVFGLASLQRNYLELHALLEFMTVYQPRMQNFSAKPANSVAACMGTITHEPEVAQLLDVAGLPFWLLRPTHTFDSENILAIVSPIQPPFEYTVECDPDQAVVYTGNSTDAKIQAMSRAARSMAWYHDPFDATSQTSSQQAVSSSTNAAAGSSRIAGPSRAATPSASGGVTRTPTTAPQRVQPYNRGNARNNGKGGPSVSKTDRDKFKPLAAEEMPSYLSLWSDALSQVDQTATTSVSPSDRYYLLPEPALLASPQLFQRRQMFLHHWRLLRDAVIFRISEAGSDPLGLSSQEWRDILEGQGERVGQRNQRTKNKRSLGEVIGPALRACSVDRLHGFPPPVNTNPGYSIPVAQQIIWELAEVNFRWELLSLDKRASGRTRPHEVKMCFAGGMLLEVLLELGKRGLAASALEERHRYHVRLATLMLDWKVQSRRPSSIVPSITQRASWSPQDMADLEWAVARYYTQSFFELFGRPAVLPMRIEGEIVAMPDVSR
ncbi:hypothetical protein B0H11DRAFT_1910025 [Mycena galericulata]|nr:hypothetical protein B0H11DRAFT_1910025 [Mycena galericulata]